MSKFVTTVGYNNILHVCLEGSDTQKCDITLTYYVIVLAEQVFSRVVGRV